MLILCGSLITMMKEQTLEYSSPLYGRRTSQIRLKQWAEQIHDCMNRPADMTVDEWCEQHGIKKANYYWRLRKVREELLKVTDSMPAFAELKAPAPETTLIENNSSAQPKIAAVIKTDKWSIEITDQASSAFLNTLIGALNHAQ